jgi:hypothetical protein
VDQAISAWLLQRTSSERAISRKPITFRSRSVSFSQPIVCAAPDEIPAASANAKFKRVLDLSGCASSGPFVTGVKNVMRND